MAGQGSGSSSRRSSTTPSVLPSASSSNPSKGSRKPVTCPVCSEVIEEAVGRKKGQDAIFCDGLCHEWVHRQCAGLTKAAFKVASTSTSPFHCPRCELAEVRKELKALSLEVAGLKAFVSSFSKSRFHSDSPVDNSQSSSSTNLKPSPAQRKPQETSERKFNLIFCGIPESPPGTSYRERLDRDYEAVISTANSLSNDLSLSAIRDCIRLGKYRPPNQDANQRPRPILVKFNNVKVVNSILGNQQHLTSNKNPAISIKRDLSKEERRSNSIFLRERYRLVSEEGIDKRHIKLRGCKVFVNNRPHGEVRSEGFMAYPSLGDLALSLTDLSTDNFLKLVPAGNHSTPPTTKENQD